MVENEKDIAYLLEKAVYIAQEGRPGPVWIDIPLDIQQMMIDETKLRHFDVPNVTSYFTKNEESRSN